MSAPIRSYRYAFVSAPPPAGFDPATLFASGELGGWFSPDDIGTLWQDTGGTVPAVVDSPVARMDAKNGTWTAFSQATGSLQPILRLNVVTDARYLDFDLADDFMSSAAQTLTSSTDSTLMVGLVANGGSANSIAFQTNGTTSSGSLAITTVNSGTVFRPILTRKIDTGAVDTTSIVLPDQLASPKQVITGILDGAAGTLEMRLNGNPYSLTGAPGGNVSGNAPRIGKLFNGGLNSQWYGALIINRKLTPQELSGMEALFAARTGAVLASTPFFAPHIRSYLAGAGTGSDIVPAGAAFVSASAYGAGGSGAKDGVGMAATGGGSGAYTTRQLAVIGGNVIPFAVGAGGAAISIDGLVGNDGTASTVSGTVSGGTFNLVAGGGTGGGLGDTGFGGVASGGTTNTNGNSTSTVTGAAGLVVGLFGTGKGGNGLNSTNGSSGAGSAGTVTFEYT